VNQKYVIATSTHVSLDGVDVSNIDDALFARKKEKKVKSEEALFNATKPVERLSAERKAAQEAVDAALTKNVEKVELLKAFLGARFRLSRNDKPHLMKF
jgi:large subunit ribosomal protein L6e